MMKSLWLPFGLLTLGLAATIWLSGIRIIVIQPIGSLPNGVTAIVADLRNVNLLDSQDAICNRHEGGVSVPCRWREAAAIAEKGKMLIRLPYSEWLYRFTNAPK